MIDRLEIIPAHAGLTASLTPDNISRIVISEGTSFPDKTRSPSLGTRESGKAFFFTYDTSYRIIPAHAGLTKRGRTNIEGIARFQAIRKNGSIVKLTVRKIRDDKKHLYTVELTDMELERPSKLRTRLDVPSMALEDGERPANQAPTRKPSSNSNIPRKSAEVNENPLIQGESNAPVKLKPSERPASAGP